MNPRSAFLGALAWVTLAASASANVPDPAHSYVPTRLVSCPAGDSTYVVIVRKFDGNPYNKFPVFLRLCSCRGYRLSGEGAHPYSVDSTGCEVSVWGSPQTGAALFPLAGGGLCAGDSVLVDAETIALGYTHVVSLDQDGDLAVDGADVVIVQSKVGTTDVTADFDGDGQVTAADVATVMAHLGHRAPDATTAVPPMPSAVVALSAPRPNPFWNETQFSLTLPGDAAVDVSVYDVDGRRVATVYRGDLGAGTHDLGWRGRRLDGSVTASGMYFVRATVAGQLLTRRAVFLAGR
jgi:hypothetical protein